MSNFLGLFILISELVLVTAAEDSNSLLGNLFSEIKTALNSDDSQTRQQLYPYGPQNNGISLGVYEALRSIARNDELECISRLLCEAAAGGQPGHRGKEIKFDKVSLTKLMSYLNLDKTSSSPMLVFGKAALLGASNRGDPYSCTINYPKCPKDESRLLYYLNNHRGGFFRYFDQNPSRPVHHNSYQKYRKQFSGSKIQFEKPGDLHEKFKKKAATDAYANKYSHSSLDFPDKNYKGKKPMVFPSGDNLLDPRILTNPVSTVGNEGSFFFADSNKLDYGFFPPSEQKKKPKAAFATDRLPSGLYFSDSDRFKANHPLRYSANSFFPSS